MTNPDTNVFQKRMEGIHASLEQSLLASLSSQESQILFRNHGYLSDIQKWHNVLSSREEHILLDRSIKELEASIYTASYGLYRQAFFSLRSAFELLFSFVKFSTNSVDFRLWKLGLKDIAWASLVDEEKGIFSHSFVITHQSLLIDSRSKYQKIAASAYRQCSEFVHDNYATHRISGNGFEFSEEALANWNRLFRVFRTVSTFVLFMRFYDTLESSQKSLLEQCILDEIGYIEGVRSFIGGE